MSLSKQNLSVVIVAFKSSHVIYDCIQSIPKEIKIIIVENSNDKNFKENVEKKYDNVKCILSSKNLGMGPGNNLGLKYVKTDFAIILNPDVIMQENSIQEIINESHKINSFAILAPLSIDNKYLNYRVDKKNKDLVNESSSFRVDSIDGYAMLLNLKKINQIEGFKDNNYFDENFFMYLENDDLCKRLIEKKENIYVVPKSKVKHLGAQAVNPEYNLEVELSRNWHWIWSKFYFNKKHYGFIVAFFRGLPNFLSAMIKYLLYFFLNKDRQKKIYLQRMFGFINALLGKNSFYRPKINN